MDAIAQLLELVDAYSTATGLSESTIATRLFNDGKRIRAVRSGGDMGVRTIAKALEAFSRDWPDGAEWPADVPRPVVARQEAA